MGISRREFLGTTAAAATVSAAKNELPKRTLGRTGVKVSILAFGSGSRWLAYKEEDQAFAALHRALDSGITYVDTAISYGNGESERRLGITLKGRRDSLFLASKVPQRKADDAERAIEASLKRLNTDHYDLLHIHSLTDAADLAAAEQGVLKVLYKLREQKVARAIGVTSHTDAAVLKTALERHDFDCTQMALNAGLVGLGRPGGPQPYDRAASFETLALPVAKSKNLGVIAMKVFGQEFLNGKATPEQLIRYVLTLPGVTAGVVGMPKLEHIDEDILAARNYKPLSPEEMRDLSGRLSVHKAAMERFFCCHQDC